MSKKGINLDLDNQTCVEENFAKDIQKETMT